MVGASGGESGLVVEAIEEGVCDDPAQDSPRAQVGGLVIVEGHRIGEIPERIRRCFDMAPLGR
jgi:hypothetical protein